MTETFLIGFTGFQTMVMDGRDRAMFFKILPSSEKPISDITIANKN